MSIKCDNTDSMLGTVPDTELWLRDGSCCYCGDVSLVVEGLVCANSVQTHSCSVPGPCAAGVPGEKSQEKPVDSGY